MDRVLFVAELGGGFGHVRRLLPVARAAAARGYAPLFLVRRPDEVAPVMEPSQFSVAAAPRTPPSLRREVRSNVASSYADILGQAGLVDAGALGAVLRAWDAILSELRPAAVVCEHSPLLSLATYGGAIRRLSLGYGFVLPPPHLPRFPRLSNAPAEHSEESLLHNVHAVLRARGRTVPGALPALLAGDAHFVTGLDALDPYRSMRRQPGVGPPGVEPGPPRPPPSDQVFGYLLGDAPATLSILTALRRSGRRGAVFVRRGTAAQRDELAGSNVTWLERPADMRTVLDRAALIIHHGSMLTAEETLLAGRPQLVVPLYLEHLLTARALEGLGVGMTVRANASPDVLAAAIGQACADSGLPRAAQAFARAAEPAAYPGDLLDTVLPSL